MNEIEWAWAAGLFEGEGCIHWHQSKRRPIRTPILSLNMCDEDVVRRFEALTNTVIAPRHGRVYPHHRPPHKVIWRWSVSGRFAVVPILERFLPHLGKRRHAKAAEVLSLCATLAHPIHCKHGHPLSGDNLYVWNGHRACKECRRLSTQQARQRRRSGAAVDIEWETSQV